MDPADNDLRALLPPAPEKYMTPPGRQRADRTAADYAADVVMEPLTEPVAEDTSMPLAIRPRRVLTEWEQKYGQIDYEDVPPCR